MASRNMLNKCLPIARYVTHHCAAPIAVAATIAIDVLHMGSGGQDTSETGQDLQKHFHAGGY